MNKVFDSLINKIARKSNGKVSLRLQKSSFPEGYNMVSIYCSYFMLLLISLFGEVFIDFTKRTFEVYIVQVIIVISYRIAKVLFPKWFL